MLVQIGTLITDYLSDEQIDYLAKADSEDFVEIIEGDESAPYSVDVEAIMNSDDLVGLIEDGDFYGVVIVDDDHSLVDYFMAKATELRNAYWAGEKRLDFRGCNEKI